jgi:hypothetical protein
MAGLGDRPDAPVCGVRGAPREDGAGLAEVGPRQCKKVVRMTSGSGLTPLARHALPLSEIRSKDKRPKSEDSGVGLFKHDRSS